MNLALRQDRLDRAHNLESARAEAGSGLHPLSRRAGVRSRMRMGPGTRRAVIGLWFKRAFERNSMGHFDDCQRVDDDTIAALKARIAKAVASGWGDSTYQSPDEWLPRWLASQRRKNEEWGAQWRASHPEPEPDEVEGADTAKPARKRRERKPTLAGALKQAGKAGAKVRGATVAADGSVSLQFGESQTDQTNDLDKWMAKRYAN
jgi:hypothetical protein